MTALLGIPEVKVELLEHLAPSLEDQMTDKTEAFKDQIEQLNSRQQETELKLDDLEQYGRRHSIRIAGIPVSDWENTDFLLCK